MQKRKYIISLSTIIFILTLLLNVQMAAAEPRKDLLADFLIQNQTTVGGFKNSNSSANQGMSPFTSYANVQLIDKLEKMDDIDKTQAEGWFTGQVDSAIISENLTDLYYAYKGLKLVEGTLNESRKEEIAAIIKDLQNENTYGFKSGYAVNSNIADTYFAVETLHEMGYISNPDYGIVQTNIAQFINNLWDENIGGFVQGENEEISVSDTYFALSCLERVNELSLSSARVQNITGMVEGYYVNRTSYEDHYGGYSLPSNPPKSSILLTYYCVSIKNMLNEDLKNTEATLNWLMARQSSKDYGFQEINPYPSSSSSSAVASYYAVNTILLIKSDALESKDYLAGEVWDLYTSPGAIAGIVIGVVGGILLLGYGYWRYRNRMTI